MNRLRGTGSLLLVLACLLPCMFVAARAAEGEGGRSRTSLNEGWRYADGVHAGAPART